MADSLFLVLPAFDYLLPFLPKLTLKALFSLDKVSGGTNHLREGVNLMVSVLTGYHSVRLGLDQNQAGFQRH